MANLELSKCDMCGTIALVSRRYYYYDIKCDCCDCYNDKRDNHFEITKHCSKCKPKPPNRISAVVAPIIINPTISLA